MPFPLTIVACLLGATALYATARALVARLTRLRVDLISVGIGPTLLRREVTPGLELRLALVPLVVWIRVVGMSPDVDDTAPGSFATASRASQLANVAAGPLGSFAFGSLLLVLVAWSQGAPVTSTRLVVLAGSPAERAGLRNGDVILEIEGTPVRAFADIHHELAPRGGRSTRLRVRQGEQQRELDVVPTADRGSIGVMAAVDHRPVTLGEAVAMGAGEAVAVLRGRWPSSRHATPAVVTVPESALSRTPVASGLGGTGTFAVGLLYSGLTFFPPFAGAAFLRWLAEAITGRRPQRVVRLGLYAVGMATLLAAAEIFVF